MASGDVIVKVADKETLDRTYANTNAILAAVGEDVRVKGVKRYGLKINKNDSNPATRCTYLFDAVGMTPAAMNYSAGRFDFGDWGNVFFVKNNYPAMVKYDGTEDYKLDPNDHTKKADGKTASDVSNTAYGGNAMSVFDGSGDKGKIWLSQFEVGNYEYMIISNVQYDESYNDDAYESTTRTGKNNTTKVTIEDPQIINGGQTAFTLAKILDNADDELVNKLKAKKVLLKVISIYQEEGKNKEYRDFVNKISDATNRQTKIDEADRRANQSVQINLQTDIFEKFGYFYERKAGEFEEALSKKIIENDMIIKRDIMLKVIWAYHGKCGEARNNSGDKIFKKDVFDSIMEIGISAERAVYSYLIHKKILCLEKLHKKNDYNSAEWGNAIRYGKFAVLSAYVAQYRDEEWSEENITQRLMELLSQWKAFESFVKTKESNKKYFSDVEEFDNYYKSVNVNSDVQEYFGV